MKGGSSPCGRKEKGQEAMPAFCPDKKVYLLLTLFPYIAEACFASSFCSLPFKAWHMGPLPIDW